MKIYIGKSKICGKGIFASRDIKRGEIIALIKGPIINHIVVDKKTSAVGSSWVGIGKNKWINPRVIFNHINHSCNPNAGIKGSRTVVALRNIKKHEEILIDYSITESDKLWTLDKECKCKSKNCRKIIKSIQFLPKEVFNSYLPYIPKYFQKVYIKYHQNKKMENKSKKIYVGKSKICGKGIFAKKDIKKEEIVGVIRGFKKFKINRNIKDVLSHPDWVGFKMHTWIDPVPPYKYLNHSCNPNVAILGNKTLIAIKNISKDEEITIDYSIIEADPRWYMKCFCGEKKCRGIIRSIQKLPKKVYNKYIPFVSKKFQALYEKTTINNSVWTKNQKF